MALPKSNLPASAQQWGRAIQSKVEELEKTVRSNEINNIARDKQLQSNIDRTSSIGVSAGSKFESYYRSISYPTATYYSGQSVTPQNLIQIPKPNGFNYATVVVNTNLSFYSELNDDYPTTDQSGPAFASLVISIADVPIFAEVPGSPQTILPSEVKIPIPTLEGDTSTCSQVFSRKFEVSGDYFNVTSDVIVTGTSFGSIGPINFIVNQNAAVYWSIN